MPHSAQPPPTNNIFPWHLCQQPAAFQVSSLLEQIENTLIILIKGEIAETSKITNCCF